MAKIIMLKGISGSGKSTKAKELCNSGNHFRVNRDDIRPMISDLKWSGHKEKMVIKIERAMVRAILQAGKIAVVDDTNLTEHHLVSWMNLAKEENASLEVQEIKVPISTCIYRDGLREKSVGAAVIYRQAIRSGMYDLGKEPNSIIFCDIDGTIADGTHRQHLLLDKTDRNRWQKYFALCGKDKPIQFVIDWLHALKASGKQIVLVSGRSSDLTLDYTLLWLSNYEVPYDYLLMRLKDDMRPDTEVKAEILKEFLLHHPKESIDFVIDDRPRVIQMWKEKGLKVYPVAGACEDF